MQDTTHSSELLEALAAISSVARSLYGPGKARKQVTDVLGAARFTSDTLEIVQALSSEHAALAIVNEALEQQMRAHGACCTTLLNLSNVLAHAAIDLKRQSVPTDVIGATLSRVETICLKTLKSMRLTLAEAVDGWEAAASREAQLTKLGERLRTRSVGGAVELSDVSLPMRLALEIVLDTPPSMLCAPELDWESAVMARIVLGGSPLSGYDEDEYSGSCVIAGALVSIESQYCATIRRSFASRTQSSRASPVVIMSGVVAINGDFSASDLRDAHGPSALGIERVRLVFVHGEVDSQAMDRSWSQRASLEDASECRCVPVESFKELATIAELCGAEIIESWDELLPLAVGVEPIELQLVEISTTSLGGVDADSEDDEDYDSTSLRSGTRVYAKLLLRVDRAPSSSQRGSSLPIKTVLARSTTHSEAAELQRNVRKALRRVTNALRSGYILPSGGAFLCACAAEIRAEATRRSGSARVEEDALAGAALERTIEALSRLSVLLLQHAGHAASDLCGDGSSYFDCFARVRAVQANYLQGIQDGASSTFYATCHFGGSDFSVLPARAEQNRRLDDYASVKGAFQRSFRLVDLALSVAAYEINAPEQ